LESSIDTAKYRHGFRGIQQVLAVDNPYDIGCFVCFPSRHIAGFHVIISSEESSKPDILASVLNTFARRGVSVVHFKFLKPRPNKG